MGLLPDSRRFNDPAIRAITARMEHLMKEFEALDEALETLSVEAEQEVELVEVPEIEENGYPRRLIKASCYDCSKFHLFWPSQYYSHIGSGHEKANCWRCNKPTEYRIYGHHKAVPVDPQ